MKKIKFFSMALALGLGLTATYAFKAHKTTQVIGVLNASATYNAGGSLTFAAVNTSDIGSGLDYSCNAAPSDYCEVTYTGVYTFTNGETITLPANDWSYDGTNDKQILQQN